MQRTASSANAGGRGIALISDAAPHPRGSIIMAITCARYLEYEIEARAPRYTRSASFFFFIILQRAAYRAASDVRARFLTRVLLMVRFAIVVVALCCGCVAPIGRRSLWIGLIYTSQFSNKFILVSAVRKAWYLSY